MPVIMPRLMRMRRAREAREMGWCSRTRLRAIWRLISREVERVARTKLRVLIFLTRRAPGGGAAAGSAGAVAGAGARGDIASAARAAYCACAAFVRKSN